MADKKPIETEGELKPIETEGELKPVEKKLYKILKHIKYGENIYKIGEKIEIADKDLEEFIKAEVIKVEEE